MKAGMGENDILENAARRSARWGEPEQRKSWDILEACEGIMQNVTDSGASYEVTVTTPHVIAHTHLSPAVHTYGEWGQFSLIPIEKS